MTSSEFDQFKNIVVFEKLQREIEQAKMSQESDLFRRKRKVKENYYFINSVDPESQTMCI
ncbi:hypothetical protein CKY18_15470 [Enterococcus gallinarum]|nr:hypothetical protein CKY18_15470 [Enterococcus gallinarum]